LNRFNEIRERIKKYQWLIISFKLLPCNYFVWLQKGNMFLFVTNCVNFVFNDNHRTLGKNRIRFSLNAYAIRFCDDLYVN